ATAGSDYTTLTGTVTILAGATTATIDVSVIDESLLEDNETVVVTLDSITSGDADISIGALNSDTVTIADDDTAEVTIAATTASATEPGGVGNDGQFTVTLSNPSDTDTVISYSVTGDATAGSDYTALTGSVTILAGATTATIDVSVIDESLLEDNETVVVTLDSITSGDADISIGASDNATVTINDDDLAEVTIAATTANATEPGGVGNDGQFTVTLSNPSDTDTVISYSVTGDATAGSDYTALTGSVTILAGATTATIDVSVLDDFQLEDNETVVVTLDSITSGDADISIGALNSDTVTIADDDTAEVTIAATTANATEPGGVGNDGQFTVTLSNPSDTDTVISYSVTGNATAGSDYTALTGSVTILAGATTATIDVSVLDDFEVEDNETVIVTLDRVTSGDADIRIGRSSLDTVIISSDDIAPPILDKMQDLVNSLELNRSGVEIAQHKSIALAKSANVDVNEIYNSENKESKVTVKIDVDVDVDVDQTNHPLGTVFNPYEISITREQTKQFMTVANIAGVNIDFHNIDDNNILLIENANEIKVKYVGNADYEGETNFIVRIYKDNVMHYQLHFKLSTDDQKDEAVAVNGANGNGSVMPVDKAQVEKVYQLFSESNLEEAIAKLEDVKLESGQGEMKAMIAELLDKVTEDKTTTFLTPSLLESIKDRLLSDQSVDIDQLLAEQESERELSYRYQLEQTKHYLLKLFGKK
ncbi:hypothetical protein L3V81_02910, partial [Thiotrichales bacterium 19S3-11]|nr:hypothetical protein [Thiotrichales bacterium 19S3-11]